MVFQVEKLEKYTFFASETGKSIKITRKKLEFRHTVSWVKIDI